MAREYSRTVRVAEQLRRELALLIQQEVKDPRLGMVTVSDVEVSSDLAHAKVYVTALGGEDKIDETVAVLNRAASFLRRELGRRLVLRTIPRLQFHYDRSISQGAELSALIEKAVHDDKQAKGS
ncbi:MAG: 30S ribosome-binding factor RbfA [Gammaproteobacteria bacterium]